MLIGSVLQLPFGPYVRQALGPVLLSLGLLWLWLAFGPGVGQASADRLAGAAQLDAPSPGRWDGWAGGPLQATSNGPAADPLPAPRQTAPRLTAGRPPKAWRWPRR
jgi:hypothetical protein